MLLSNNQPKTVANIHLWARSSRLTNEGSKYSLRLHASPGLIRPILTTPCVHLKVISSMISSQRVKTGKEKEEIFKRLSNGALFLWLHSMDNTVNTAETKSVDFEDQRSLLYREVATVRR